MAKHTVVTSFSAEGFDRYGVEFLRSFAAHWPKDVRCAVFYEQLPEHELAADKRFEWHKISLVPGLSSFLQAVSHFPLTCGDQGGKYNIQTDARMARKCFIEAHAVETFGGKVFWMDADCVTHSPVPADLLDDLLPDDKLCCYLGRPNMYTESGFLGFNADHPDGKGFLNIYRQLFETGTFLLFPAWHDCVAFDQARKGYEQQNPGQFVNLGKGVPPSPGHHVFVNSVLGTWFDHKKGPRKDMARTPDEDLVVPRSEAYWSGQGDSSLPES